MNHIMIWFTCLLLCGSFVVIESEYFWHVTDFHFDHTYRTSRLSCTKIVSSPGEYGDQWCDSPWQLVQDSIDNMAAIKPDVDFILWTGDSVAHIADANMTLDINLEILENITRSLKSSFHNVSVFASLGNHDFYPSDQANYSESEIYQKVSDKWEVWIKNQSQIEHFRKGGYYTARVTEKLLLLALNTNLYYTANKITENVDDPAGQMEWMISQLQKARDNREKVIVTGHVPPGLVTPGLTDWFYPRHKAKFVSILLNYSDVIVATHFGHDHSDGFKILQNEKGDKAVTQFTAPSVTPWRYRTETATGNAHNPGIRLVQYNNITGEHINYVQYFINITESNSQNKTKWARLYSFKDAYGVNNMSVQSLRDIFSRMEHNNGREYSNKYCTYSLVSNYSLTCSDEMRADIYCGGLHYDLKKAQDCKNKPKNQSPLHYLNSYIMTVAFVIEAIVILL